MSKILTSAVLAVVASAIMSFCASANPVAAQYTTTVIMASAVLGLIVG